MRNLGSAWESGGGRGGIASDVARRKRTHYEGNTSGCSLSQEGLKTHHSRSLRGVELGRNSLVWGLSPSLVRKRGRVRWNAMKKRESLPPRLDRERRMRKEKVSYYDFQGKEVHRDWDATLCWQEGGEGAAISPNTQESSTTRRS